jgi:hypothetical protein
MNWEDRENTIYLDICMKHPQLTESNLTSIISTSVPFCMEICAKKSVPSTGDKLLRAKLLVLLEICIFSKCRKSHAIALVVLGISALL